MSTEEFLNIVKTYHPVVLQANINVEKSDAEIMAAKGNFDPKFNLYKAEKRFNNTNYYNEFSSEISIPTWFGVDVYAGAQNLTGEKLNNSETEDKSTYLGINIPLAKNLLMDKRRAYLKQAKLFRQMSEIEQNAIINDILYEGVSAYYDWSSAYQNYLIAEEILKNAQLRINFIQKSYNLGEKPAIDIVEANTQLQSFQILRNEKLLKFQNAGLELTNFLWLKNNTPYQITENIIPKLEFEEDKNRLDFNVNLDDLLKQAQENNPNFLIYDQKLKSLDIERRLKFQDLLPKIDFSYNFMNKGFGTQNYFSENPLFQNNFQYGLKVEFPIFFREGRANYKIAKLKISETQLQQTQKGQEIAVKIKSYFNEYKILKEQITLQNEIIINYKKLLRAEEIRFQNGESSLFLINSRENKLFEGLEKINFLNFKYLESIYKLYWSAGILR
ncbi:TolC family protein [Frigoriflavimonas asaccharolytica]|uniref:Outer membrane protein TolC n=1 Tax=Frigoriflavimonas asaccharolytica TaxID=2735899 RepID=A0A8J8G685_9FLAO|nr:TolC family protein [Frigoriflavimonas asaccharolytica]NRS91776.1 outer membrane protein TolC [Frigoriflavimonas asaccharolytica]